MELLLLIAGLGAGFLAGWWVSGLRREGRSGAGAEAELRSRLAEQERLLAESAGREKDLIADRSTAIAERESLRLQGEDARRRAQALEEKSGALDREKLALSTELATARADLNAAHQLLAAQREAQEKSLAEMREAFRALSADALRQSAPEFMRMAKDQFEKLQESAKGDLSRRQEAISGLLKPLEAQLKTYQDRLQQSESGQSALLGEVRKQLESLTARSESLAKETEQFRMVLNSSQSRGRWGEVTLRRVVESAGMSPFCDFDEQVHGDDSRPDMLVRLPGDRVIIVDAKVPDLDFLETLESGDAETRKQSLRTHSDKLKNTIRDLARRNYPAKHPNAMDYVVLFLPAESLFSAALEGDRNLIAAAAECKIMLATPSSLIGLLRAISLGWDQMKQTENTRAIAEAAEELYGRVLKFTEHFEKLRDSLVSAGDHLNAAVGSYETRVRPQGQRLLSLGVPGKELPEIPAADRQLRRIRSA